jgi:septum formation protein
MLGIPHEVLPSDLVERPLPGEVPEAMAVRLAQEKARAVAQQRPGVPVLAADTVVTLDGDVLGKPVDAREAALMLARLSGREHRVITAVALARPDGELDTRCDVTRVWFRPLTPDVIEAYVDTKEPLDKAGSYGVQGYGAVLVERVDGDFFGVMGLPLRLVIELLDRVGMPYRFNRYTGTA